MPEKRMTIEDIARLAGVSKATVSRVLNQKPDVDPATRERILHLIAQYDYTPNLAAAGLAGGRRYLVSIVTPSLTWPFVSEVLRAIIETLDHTPYSVLLYSRNDRSSDQEHQEALQRLLSTHVHAGLIAIYPGPLMPRLVDHQQVAPVVVIDDQASHEYQPWICVENQAGAYMAVCHLLQHGYQRIAHIQGPMHYLCAHDRHQGYCQALAEAGVPFDPVLVVEGDFQYEGGRRAARRLLSLPAECRPTAIFASNDHMAYGVCAVAEEYGLHIPEDLAVVGFDDIEQTAHHLLPFVTRLPALTTVRQPFYGMGELATQLLLSLLEATSSSEAQRIADPLLLSYASLERGKTPLSATPLQIRLPVELIIRSSCGVGHGASHPSPIQS